MMAKALDHMRGERNEKRSFCISSVYNTAVFGMLQLGGPLSIFCSSNNEVNAIGTDTNGNMVFYRNWSFEDVSMVIDDETGNVGIGETNHVDPLHIVADANGDNAFPRGAWERGTSYNTPVKKKLQKT